MRNYKTFCIICDKETRARRTTTKGMDVCYKCHKEAERKKPNTKEDDNFINKHSRQLNTNVKLGEGK